MSYISQVTQPDGTKLRVSLKNHEANAVPVTVNGTVTSTVADGLGVKIFDILTSTYKGLQFNAGSPQICSQDYLLALAEGDISGHTPWSKIGWNGDIGTSEETLWSYNTQYVWITTAGQVEVLSSNANDTGGGSGARTVRIGYLKSDYSESSVTLTLAGATPVASGASHADVWRINSFRVMTAGTSNAPEGNLTLRQVTGGLVVSYIRLGKTRARSSFYTVPLGKTLYVTSIAFSASSSKEITFTTHANYENGTGTILQRGMFMPYSEVILNDASYTKQLEMPTMLPATVDLKISAVASLAGGVGTGHLRGWLE